jgi:hypothetical protein
MDATLSELVMSNILADINAGIAIGVMVVLLFWIFKGRQYKK